MAADPMNLNLTDGSAKDNLQALLAYLGQRAGTLNPTLGTLTGQAPGAANALGTAIGNYGMSTGLSPEALSALRTQATSGINDQYQGAAQALNTQLLRRGAMGTDLPGSSGDIARGYAPLYAAAEAAKTKANTDTILADEAAKQKSLTENNANALNAANSVFGNTSSIFNAGNADLGQAASVANSIADLEGPSLLKLLGTSALTGAATGTGIFGKLASGGGTNGSGNFGLVGDLLSKIPGLGGGGDAAINAERTANDVAGTVFKTAGAAGSAAIPGLAGTAAAPATGLTGALGLGGGSGLMGLGAATIPVVGGVAVGIGLLAKHFFGNGGDRLAANELTGPNGVHEFFNQATAQINQTPDGPEKQAAVDARDRAMEQALVAFSKKDKNHYYQAKQTLQQFSGFTTVRPLLG